MPLDKEEERYRIVCAYKLAQDNQHELMDIVSAARDRKEACEMLMARWSLDERAAQAVLEMRSARFTCEEREKVAEEVESLSSRLQ